MRPWNLRHHHTIPITWERFTPHGKDRRGNPLAGYDTPTQILGCVFAPSTSTEPTEAGRTPETTHAVLYAPPHARINGQDRITTPDGTIWQVDGAPQIWPANPLTANGRPPGVVIHLKKTEG